MVETTDQFSLTLTGTSSIFKLSRVAQNGEKWQKRMNGSFLYQETVEERNRNRGREIDWFPLMLPMAKT